VEPGRQFEASEIAERIRQHLQDDHVLDVSNCSPIVGAQFDIEIDGSEYRIIVVTIIDLANLVHQHTQHRRQE